jgi:hypothetical protein
MKKICRSKAGSVRQCKSTPCSSVHEKRTCEEEASGMECSFLKKGTEYRKEHIQWTVHKRDIGEEEWRVRYVLAGLRGLHEQGVYTG